MTPETMRRALAAKSEADKLLRQYNEWVLVRVDGHSYREFLNVGDPIAFRKDSCSRQEVPIPETARRYVFRLWKHEIALKYNALVRELNQIGMQHDLSLLSVVRPVP